jgi:hypothetical protein
VEFGILRLGFVSEVAFAGHRENPVCQVGVGDRFEVALGCRARSDRLLPGGERLSRGGEIAGADGVSPAAARIDVPQVPPVGTRER